MTWTLLSLRGVYVEGEYIQTIVTIDRRIEQSKSPSARSCQRYVVSSVLEAVIHDACSRNVKYDLIKNVVHYKVSEVS